MSHDDALDTFLAEARELLEQMESSLLTLETSPGDIDATNAVFRAAHTIKGSAGLFQLDAIVGFTHVVESVLDRIRDGRLPLNESIGMLLFDCCDHISALIDCIGAPLERAAALEDNDAALLARLADLLPDEEKARLLRLPATPAAPSPTAAASVNVEREPGATAQTGNWHLSLRFGRDVFRQGLDPLGFIRFLNNVGRIVHVETLTETVPVASEMEPEACYLAFEISLDSDHDKASIESVFEFVRDDCELRILPPHSAIDDYVALIRQMPAQEMRLGEILVACGTLTSNELEMALQYQADSRREPAPPIGQILIEQAMVQPPVVEAALEKQKQNKEGRSQDANHIRVDARKLDHLISLVGELIISGASTNIVAQRIGSADLLEATSTLSRLVSEVRDCALNLRMVPIGATFNRFHRVVRDASKELAKEIELIIWGADTELDKTVVEKIGDPLTHLIRNAIDHGIEAPELRAQRGKPACGKVRLNAFHDSGNIVIDVEDDGGGLNREKIRRKAIERLIIDESQQLSDEDIQDLIFEPGFSTAAQVTNLSGRGVGMDVVRRNIEMLRGSVEVSSIENVGTRFRIRLPLTLAIIDGFLVGVGNAAYVLPLDVVVECIEGSHLDALRGDRACSFINLRGEVLPCIRLREIFDIQAAPARRENVVVVHYDGCKAGIIVDALMGEIQAVLRPSGKLFSNAQGIGGFTILGSGEVALVLDVKALALMAASNDAAIPARPATSADKAPRLQLNP